MVVKLQQIVPFGRSLDEYAKMFNLAFLEQPKRSDKPLNILGVADGPASFNAEATQRGYTVTSIDPIYQFSGNDILSRFEAVVDDIIEQVRSTPDDWVWSYHGSPDALRASREQTIRLFLQDYDSGKASGRYIPGELPHLPFADQFADLALCSHFLFLYSDHLDYTFHRDAILELLRVAQEVRIFPLLTLMLERSPYIVPICNELQQQGYTVSIEKADYEFQKGGNEVMIIHRL